MPRAASPSDRQSLFAQVSAARGQIDRVVTAVGRGNARWIAGAFGVAMLWFIFGYIPATPSYAIWTFYRDVENHDAEAAARFVDFDQVVQGLIETSLAEKTKNEKSEDANAANLIGAGIARMMSGTIASLARVKFKQQVEQGGRSVADMGGMLTALLHLHHRGRDSADTRIKDQEGKVIIVTMTRSGGQWKVSALSGPAVAEAVRKATEEMNSRGKDLPGEGRDL